MRSTFVRTIALGIVVAGIVVAVPGRAQNFGAVTWTPLRQGGVPLGDSATDANNERNIVGDNTDTGAAAYVSQDATYLYFRIRLDKTPLAQDGVTMKPFGWSCAVEANGTLANYEFLGAVNGIENNGPGGENDQVEWRHNGMTTTSTPGGSISEEAETLVDRFTRSAHTFVQTAAGTNFSGDPDFFLAWAIPLATIRAGGNGAPGIPAGTPMRFACGTSNNARNYSADPACSLPNTQCTLSNTWSDPLSCTAAGCVPVSGAGDSDGDGVPDAQETALGTNPNSPDSDGDGIRDNVELSASGSTGPYTGVDTDADGLIDARDTDSDNDCASDQTEGVAAYRTKASPADPNCTNGQICNTTNGQCVAPSTTCTGDRGTMGPRPCADATKPACNTSAPFNGFCTQCSPTNVTLCPGVTPACDLPTGTCAPCDGDRGSGAPRACQDPAKPFCNPKEGPEGGLCSTCRADPDCVGPGHTGPTCDMPSGACIDVDTDGDGVNDTTERLLGSDPTKPDSDGDGIDDKTELTPVGGGSTSKVDSDGDNVPDALDLDSDGDGLLDKDEGKDDLDGDNKPNWRDADDDDDGILTKDEIADTTAAAGTGVTDDVDGDGRKNWYDNDADGDGTGDAAEGRADTDGDGKPQYLDADGAIPPLRDDRGSMEGGGLACAASSKTSGGISGIVLLALGAIGLLRRRRR